MHSSKIKSKTKMCLLECGHIVHFLFDADIDNLQETNCIYCEVFEEPSKNIDIDIDCLDSFEDRICDLRNVENKLIDRFKDIHPKRIRQHLLDLIKKKQIEEDELIAEWLEYWSSIVNYF